MTQVTGRVLHVAPKAETQKADSGWTQLDETSLSTAAQKALARYRELSRQRNEARGSFENIVNGEMPEGKKMVFGYKYGKLVSKIVDDEGEKPVKSTKPKMTLSEFIASQLGAGRKA